MESFKTFFTPLPWRGGGASQLFLSPLQRSQGGLRRRARLPHRLRPGRPRGGPANPTRRPCTTGGGPGACPRGGGGCEGPARPGPRQRSQWTSSPALKPVAEGAAAVADDAQPGATIHCQRCRCQRYRRRHRRRRRGGGRGRRSVGARRAGGLPRPATMAVANGPRRGVEGLPGGCERRLPGGSPAPRSGMPQGNRQTSQTAFLLRKGELFLTL